MAEGIRFNDNGTISIPVGGETYTLRRPNTKQLMYYWDRLDDVADKAKETFQGWLTELSELEEDSEEFDELQKRIRRSPRTSYEHTVFPWLREVFEELGSKPLPQDLTDAPSEITSIGLPLQIVDFWRTVPLAHSGKRRN